MLNRTRDRALHRTGCWAGYCWTLLLCAGCAGPQSALEPGGAESEQVLGLLRVMVVGGAVIAALVGGVAVHAARSNRENQEKLGRALIIGGGVVVPAFALAALLVWSLPMMTAFRAPGDGLRIEVSGEQWWWRVRYWPEGAETPIETANLIVLPAGERTEIVLDSPDVIHSFWIPALAGKVDMIPGRRTRLVVEPQEPAELRGQCAEFCGTSHALMSFPVEVVPAAAFAGWLEREAAHAAAAEPGPAEAGAELFSALGCGGCHNVRGTGADGVIGPDLTHFASRPSIGAGTLPNEPEALRLWLATTGKVKPDVMMPSFGMLGAPELDALIAYLAGLR
jgi:cytochrome c oxidase subunit 2